MYLFYNILLHLVLPFVVAYHLYRSVSRGRSAALSERFGFIADNTASAKGESRPIWVHAVSVGETIAVRPLLRSIKAHYPEKRLILSTMTETGRGVAATFAEVDHCLYFPFDYPFAVRRLLRQIHPELVIIMETELWPNFLREARFRGIPVVIANGRISDRSFAGYLRARCLFRPVLENVARFCMQSDEDCRRIIAIGADPEKVVVARNLKFDTSATPVSSDHKAELRGRFGIPVELRVLTAGSTHQGEEEAVIDAFRTLLQSSGDFFLVLVPRHPERAVAVAGLLQDRGLTCRRRSEISGDAPLFLAGQVLLVDTIGELMQFYGLSDLVFVGGSLVPAGGHNLLEPASLGVPLIYGPHMGNFREITALVKEYGAGVAVEDAGSLASACRQLLNDTEGRRSMGDNGIRLIKDNGGATQRHMAVIEGVVKGEM